MISPSGHSLKSEIHSFSIARLRGLLFPQRILYQSSIQQRLLSLRHQARVTKARALRLSFSDRAQGLFFRRKDWYYNMHVRSAFTSTSFPGLFTFTEQIFALALAFTRSKVEELPKGCNRSPKRWTQKAKDSNGNSIPRWLGTKEGEKSGGRNAMLLCPIDAYNKGLARPWKGKQSKVGREA